MGLNPSLLAPAPTVQLTLIVSGRDSSASTACKSSGYVPVTVLSPPKFSGPRGTDLLPLMAAGGIRYMHIQTPSAGDLRPYEVAFWSQRTQFFNAANPKVGIV